MFWGGVVLGVLIVGYDAELTALTGKILERSGYDTTCCLSDISKILSFIESKSIKLVIAELESDENERIKFCKTIKSVNNPPKPILIGQSSEEEIQMLNAGADDFIKKPYKTAVFLARISALMRQCKNVL